MVVEATGGETAVCPPVGGREAIEIPTLHGGKVARGLRHECC
jgi:hypothetical protein